jgi:hypothetical protein
VNVPSKRRALLKWRFTVEFGVKATARHTAAAAQLPRFDVVAEMAGCWCVPPGEVTPVGMEYLTMTRRI